MKTLNRSKVLNKGNLKIVIYSGSFQEMDKIYLFVLLT